MPKLEYVIKVRLTEKQVKEYRMFLAMECDNQEAMREKLLANCYVFARIYTHPYQIIVHREEKVCLCGPFEMFTLTLGEESEQRHG